MDFNPADLMKNIQSMQTQMKDVQGKLKTLNATGTSGGGLVKIEINGEMEVTNVTLDPIVVDSRDIEMLQDLIIAAMNSAQSNIKDIIQSEMADSTGINMPFDLNGFK
ncbi:MAG: YbaB/EbfC family nucleoid-associated protein [Spirochaetaceae bacterium]